MSANVMLLSGSLVMASGVLIGAFGAHGLPGVFEALGRTERLETRADWLETGVRYQLIHGLGLIAVACLSLQTTGTNSRLLSASGWAFLIGTLLFSGSLYSMTLGPATWRKLGMVTPMGGMSLIVGWVLLACHAFQRME